MALAKILQYPNVDIAHLITSIDSTLLPLAGKEANPTLWRVHDQLQEWKFAIECNHKDTHHQAAAIAKSILKNIKTLPDQNLAQHIERIVTLHSHH